jgi:hypothetical protein
MVRYRRNFVAGGTFFFTATLVDRSLRALIDHIEALRAATRDTRRSHPFAIDAIVGLAGPLAPRHDFAQKGTRTTQIDGASSSADLRML